jgi:heme/copper-type cytochrome/quinol oxidase subunit 1
MEQLRWIIGIALLGLGAWISLANWVCVWNWVTSGRRFSLLPLFGGSFAAVGLLVLPVGAWAWAWIPLVLDLGCAPMLIGAVVFHLRRHFK